MNIPVYWVMMPSRLAYSNILVELAFSIVQASPRTVD